MAVALVTGGNKGLGYAVVRALLDQGHTVYLGARDRDRGEAAAAELGAVPVVLNVTDDRSIAEAVHTIVSQDGRLDVLVNNAGVWDRVVGADGIASAAAAAQLETNVGGVVRVTQAALPALRRSAQPVVVNVSSGLGSFVLVEDPASHQFGVRSIVYSATKAAVNMLTLRYAQSVPEVAFVAVDPGFLATDLHGDASAEDPATGARVIARFTVPGAKFETGRFYDGQGLLGW